MYVCEAARVCVYYIYAGSHTVQKATDLLELEVQVVMICLIYGR